MRATWTQILGWGIMCSMILLRHSVVHATNKPLSLEEVISIALKENVDIQIAENDRQATIFSNRMDTVNLWIPTPTLSFLKHTWNKGAKNPCLALGPLLTLEGKPLALFTKILTTKINRHNISVAKLTKMTEVRKVLEGVVTGYYGLVVAQKKMELANIAIKSATAHLKLAETKFSIGRGSKLDYLSAKVTLQEVKLALIKNQQSLKEARQALNLKLSKPQNEATVVQSTISLQPIWDITAITKETMVDLDTAIQEHQVTIATTSLTQEKTALLSNISLSGSFHSNGYEYDFKNRQWDNGYGYDFKNRQWGNAASATSLTSTSLTIGVSLNLGELLLLPGKVKKARTTLANAKLALTQKKLAAENDLENKKAAYHHTLAVYRIQEERLKLSKQKLAVTKEEYRLNRKTLCDLQEEEKDIYKEESELIEQAVAVKKAEFEIYKLSGLLHTNAL